MQKHTQDSNRVPSDPHPQGQNRCQSDSHAQDQHRHQNETQSQHQPQDQQQVWPYERQFLSDPGPRAYEGDVSSGPYVLSLLAMYILPFGSTTKVNVDQAEMNRDFEHSLRQGLAATAVAWEKETREMAAKAKAAKQQKVMEEAPMEREEVKVKQEFEDDIVDTIENTVEDIIIKE